MIIDTNRRLTPRIDCLKSSGVATAIRYYARTTAQPEKRLVRAEAEALIGAGLSIAVVHQSGGASPDSFSSAAGKKDAEYSFAYAIETIGQPAGAAIYFAVDFDCDAANYTSRVLPHFKAIDEVAKSGVFSRTFEIGAYGNGVVLSRLLDAGLCKYAWISQSMGHHESKQFKASGRWTLAQRLPSSLCGIGVDVDDLNPAASSFGRFSSLQPTTTAHAAPALAPYRPGLTVEQRAEIDNQRRLSTHLRRLGARPGRTIEAVREGVHRLKVRPNEACPCGSGLKYKRCHGRT